MYPGIKLEVVWEQYRARRRARRASRARTATWAASPACRAATSSAPRREINKKNVNANRKHANHTFYGPGYSIAHPGVFPFNPKADRWSMREWLLFDWRAGWGTDAFEDAVDDGAIRVAFPPSVEGVGRSLRRPRDHRRQSQEEGAQGSAPRSGDGERLARRRARSSTSRGARARI